MRPYLRPTDLLLIALLVTGIAWGCASPDRSSSGRAATRAPGTQTVDVAGRSIGVPPPEGLVDFLSAGGQGGSRTGSGDLMAAVYVPAGDLEAAKRPGYRPGAGYVMLVVPSQNSVADTANVAEFDSYRGRWQQRALELSTPEGARVARALEHHEAGDGSGEIELPVPAANDRMVIAVEAPAPEYWRVMTLGRQDPGRPDAVDFLTVTRVLVRGRVLELSWQVDPVSGIGDLANVRERSDRWARAVVAANR